MVEVDTVHMGLVEIQSSPSFLLGSDPVLVFGSGSPLHFRHPNPVSAEIAHPMYVEELLSQQL
jgi:hypothetical protein